MEIETRGPEMIGATSQPTVPPIVYSQFEPFGANCDFASFFTSDAALDSVAYSTPAFPQWSPQPVYQTVSQWSFAQQLFDPYFHSSPVEPPDTTVPAYEIEHLPPTSQIAQRPFQPLRSKPAKQQTPVLSLAASTKPLRCKNCSKSYDSERKLRRHNVEKHGAEKRTGGRPSNSSRRLPSLL
ncbi:unnamed protein product [Penicillium salamii]|nr:unnamed protein product [Penicillium salamii]CAG8243694.1 unnamed protein product [Penicillium salamii]